MMRVLKVLTASLICCVLLGNAYGVIPYSEDFNYAAGTDPTTVLEWEVDSGDPYFNGSGQLVMEGTSDGMNRGIEGGDFVMTVEWSSVDMDPEEQGWSVFWYGFEHNGDQGQYFEFNIDSWWEEGENTSLYLDAYSTDEDGNVYDEYIGELDSLTLQVVYDSTAGEYSFSRSINGGAMTSMITIGGYDADDSSRVESFWADSETEDLSVEFDNYNITPEPATIALMALGAGLFIRKRK